jgi:hypothetical protein
MYTLKKLKNISSLGKRSSFDEVRNFYDKMHGKYAFDNSLQDEKRAILLNYCHGKDEIYMNNWLNANYPPKAEETEKGAQSQ